MYKLAAPDEDSVLRPEGTAGAMRAYLQNCIRGESNQWFYAGSMFRRERPQKGRYREFYQIGIENIGTKVNPYTDAEMIYLGYQLLDMLKIPKVQVNHTVAVHQLSWRLADQSSVQLSTQLLHELKFAQAVCGKSVQT